jgi:hypothetical protein
MDRGTSERDHEPSDARRTVSGCADLIACIVSGAIARRQNIAYSQNPYLEALRDDAMTGSERNGRLGRAEAWWDGWEEMNLVMRAAAAPIDESGSSAATGRLRT